jgi:hypothetical protein
MATEKYNPEKPRAGRLGRHLTWTRLGVAKEGLLYPPTFAAFLIQVKSNTPIGRELHIDPLAVLRRIPGIPIGRERNVRAILLRANAEEPANPVHRLEIWVIIPGSKLAVGIQYKYNKDQTVARNRARAL